ncbi:hypothetical protein AB0465_41355 [Streptomyces griseoviridis]
MHHGQEWTLLQRHVLPNVASPGFHSSSACPAVSRKPQPLNASFSETV